MLLRHRQAIILQREHIALDGLADVGDRGLTVLALRDASRKTGALSDPKTIFTRIYDDLSHGRDVMPIWCRGKGTPTGKALPDNP